MALRLVFMLTLLFSVSAEAGTFQRLCEMLMIKSKPKIAETTILEKPAPKSLWIDEHFKDPNWVLSEAMRARQELLALTPAQRVQMPIEYFRDQIPLLRHILQSLGAANSSVAYMMIDANGQRIHPEIATIGQAVEFLMNEGRTRFNDRTANQAWFTEFALEVIALRWYVSVYHPDKWQMPTIEKFTEWYEALMAKKKEFRAIAILRDSPEWFLYHMRNYKTELAEQMHKGILHWPTIAQFKVVHFQNWHLDIKPLQYGELMEAQLDGLPSDDFEVFGHDINFHQLPDEFRPHQKMFSSFRDIFNEKVKSEKWDQQVLLKLLWFEVTHESPHLYRLYSQLMFQDFKIERTVEEELRKSLNRDQDPSYFIYILKRRHVGELTTSLKNMTPPQFEAEAQQAYYTFVKLVTESFLDLKTDVVEGL